MHIPQLNVFFIVTFFMQAASTWMSSGNQEDFPSYKIKVITEMDFIRLAVMNATWILELLIKSFVKVLILIKSYQSLRGSCNLNTEMNFINHFLSFSCHECYLIFGNSYGKSVVNLHWNSVLGTGYIYRLRRLPR